MILPGFQNQDAQKFYQEAAAHLRKGAYDEGIQCLQSAIQLAPYEAKYHNNLGQALILKGEREAGFAAFKKAFDLDPNDINTLNNLGVLSLEREELPQAKTYLERSLSIKPEHNFDAMGTLGIFYGQQKLYGPAENLLTKALALRPDSYVIQRNLAIVSLPLQKLEETIRYCEAALAEQPDDYPVLLNYALALSRARRRQEAIDIYKRLLEKDKTDQKAWINLVSAYESVNDIEAARKTAAEAEQYCDTLEFEVAKARLAMRDENSDKAAIAKNLEDYIGEIENIDPQNASAFFELGRLYDRMNNPEKAFYYFAQGNQYYSQSTHSAHIDKNAYLKTLDKIIGTIDKDWAAGQAPPLPYEEKPEMVFLIGFPRSGTTLLDQIMHSHPDIEVTDEYPALGSLLSFFDDAGESYPEILTGLSAERIKDLRKEYFKVMHESQIPMDKAYLVDKMPLNMAHAGLAYRLFPEAKFIVALRHPCDCVLSGFMQQFRINTAMANFYTIEDAAHLYDKVFTAWEMYKKLLPLNVHNVKYEDVVADFDPTIAALLEFIGVPWDDAVLAYDKTARERGVINTPSYNQVTQKIYTRSKGRWEKYREQMEPVLDALLPWAEKHGYK